MAEEVKLPPCKLCGGPDVCPAFNNESEWASPSCENPNCDAYDMQLMTFLTKERADAFWIALMSDTAALRKGARMGVEAAAKWHDVKASEWMGIASIAEKDEAEEEQERAAACRVEAGGHKFAAIAIRAIDTDKLVDG